MTEWRSALLWALVIATPAAATNDPTLVALATWQRADQDLALVVKLTEQLSKRQKDLINSGFSTHFK